MDYQALIDKYYPEKDELARLLATHSRQVADRCLAIAARHPELHIDTTFVEEAAMLHDIGIRWCHAPGIGCHGTEHYLCHGLIGARLLRQEGYERHARVCERHTGTGITRQQIIQQDMPLPPGDYTPETIEEQLVCYADKFYSKSKPQHEATIDEVKHMLARFGQEGVEKFTKWSEIFG